jgi:PAS domain S-box-containing protein
VSIRSFAMPALPGWFVARRQRTSRRPSNRAGLALGAASAAWVAGMVALLTCALTFVVVLSLQVADVVEQRAESGAIQRLTAAERQFTRTLETTADGTLVPGEDEQPARQAWSQLLRSLEEVCRGLPSSSPYRASLNRLCADRADLQRRVTPLIEAYRPPQLRLDQATSRDLLGMHDDLAAIARQVDADSEVLTDWMVRNFGYALLVIAFSIVAFGGAGLLAVLLIGRATSRYRTKWREASQAAQQAKETRDLLRETIDALPGGVVVYDPQERLVMFNRLAAAVTPSLQLADAIGRTYEDLARETGRQLEAAGHGPQAVDEWVARFRRKDIQRTRQTGDGRWFDWSERLTPSGHTVGLRVDVTEMKNHEQAVEQARAEYQSLVGSLTDVVFKLDFQTGAFCFAGGGAADFFGVPAERLLGTPFIDYVAADDQAAVRAIARDKARHRRGMVDKAEFRMKAAGGVLRHIEARYRTIVDEQGRATVAGVIRDVEERVRLEQRLAEETARLRSIVESSGALVALTDRDLNLVMVNSGFTNMTGIAAADAVGRPVGEVLACPIAPIDRATSEPTRFALTLGEAAGQRRLIAVTATPVADAFGRTSNIVLLGVDDTERQHAEKALHDSERFATVGEMAGTMAHEISQPLQVINIACASARDELAEAQERDAAPDAGYLRLKLDRIAQQVEGASRIVGDLRAFVHGSADHQPEPFDPVPAIKSAVKLTAYAMRQAGITLSVAAADGLPMVTGLSARLEQVMVNLLNNARDSGTPTIDIVAEAVQRNGRPFVRIAVQDAGLGIPPDLLPQLFVSFVTTKPRGTGTGLGLRICRRIVEEMGGSIVATNLCHGGACFEVFLPAALESKA